MLPSGGCRRRCSYYNSGIRSSSTLPGRSVTSPTLRSVRRSSELSGPTLVNTSSVVFEGDGSSCHTSDDHSYHRRLRTLHDSPLSLWRHLHQTRILEWREEL